MANYQQIHDLIDGVRHRWRAVAALRAFGRGAVAAAAAIGGAALASRWTLGAPGLLISLAAVALLLAATALVVSLWPLRRVPGDGAIARYIEERAPSLDDRLVSAVDVARHPAASPLAAAMLADAARRSAAIDVDTIVPSRSLRAAALRAAAAAVVLGIVLFAARGPAREAADAASLTFFPARTTLQVTPGSVKIKAGSPLAIEARLVGNQAPVIAQLQIADGDGWRSADMAADKAGPFRTSMAAVTTGFRYRVVAGAVASPSYEVTVVQPPRVTRIDVDYTYPDGLRLAPRTEPDSGDIYAPAGTDVRVHVYTDKPAAVGQLALANGAPIALAPTERTTALTASLKVTHDNSYRVTLSDRDGMANPGDTEYFIRMLEDRPPDVRVLKPATDRSVTRLEEVDIDAQAEDDYGVAQLDLVYAVKGGSERVVPFRIPRGDALVTGHHTIYLEDLDVQPGDFVSYYVRARDLTRGTRPNEARSDIFFLEVKPYEQEFAMAQSQGNMPGGGQTGIDELVTAQKEIVVATWKLDRRARTSQGKSEEDVRSVGRAEAELKTRVEQTSSSFRESNMRDPRRRQPQRGRGGAPTPPAPELKAGETLPEEDNMTAAAAAMGKAAESLEAVKTNDALAPEMEALNRLLKAQADVKKREVMRQQSGQGNAGNRSNYDMSGLFDKELQRMQQTNYETRSSAEQKNDGTESALDKIKDLARRQDELLKAQQELARKRAQMTEEELKRELEKLTRDQSELRQKAEELARQMQQQSGQQGQQSGQQSGSQQSGSQQSGSQQSGSQQSGSQQSGGQQAGSQQSQSGRGNQSPQSARDEANSQRMRDVSEEMRNATSELRRQDANQASARSNRALEKLRELQQGLETAGRPDDRRRALGEMQLEARQLADAERQIASELARTGQGDAAKDTVRRLAGEQERLADRARRLQQGLQQSGEGGRQAADASRQSPAASGKSAGASQADAQKAAADAAKELERQQLASRMQQSADAMRSAASDPKNGRGNTASRTSDDPRAQAPAQQDLARTLDKVADKLASATSGQNADTQKLSDQRAHAQDLRDRLNATARELAAKSGQVPPAGRSGAAAQPGQASQSGEAGQGRQAGHGGRGAAQGQSAQQSAGESGQSGAGQGGGSGGGPDVEQLRQQYQRQLQETTDFLDAMRRDDPGLSRGGGGGFSLETPSTQAITAPGTESFKQDFAKWEEMRRQATQALDAVESSLSKKIQAKQAKDRLAAGSDDKAPASYQKQVDSYFKAIASRKKP